MVIHQDMEQALLLQQHHHLKLCTVQSAKIKLKSKELNTQGQCVTVTPPNKVLMHDYVLPFPPSYCKSTHTESKICTKSLQRNVMLSVSMEIEIVKLQNKIP